MLSNVPFFTEIGCRQTIERLEQVAFPAKFTPGQIIFEHGDSLNFLYIIKSGEVNIGRISKNNGKEVTFSILKAGSVFGEVSIFDGGCATAHAEARTNVELLLIPRADVLRVFSESPLALMSIIQNLCRLVRKVSRNAEERMLDQQPSARAAMARLFLAKMADGGKPMQNGNIRLPGSYRQGDLAKLTGFTRQKICVEVNKMKDEGVIEWDPRTGHITIISEDHINEIANQ